MIYLTPSEAAAHLGISRSTITRCKQKGAPVHYWGSCGRTYRIDPDEFLDWMNCQGPEMQQIRRQQMSVDEMRAARHRMVSHSA